MEIIWSFAKCSGRPLEGFEQSNVMFKQKNVNEKNNLPGA